MAPRNPSAIPADTSPEAWRVQMAAIRKMTQTERLRQWEEFNDALADLELEAHRRRYPDLTDRERFLIRMRLKYGAELSARIWPETASLSA